MHKITFLSKSIFQKNKILSLLFFIFLSSNLCFAQECEEKLLNLCPMEARAMGQAVFCFEKNMDKIPEECRSEIREFVDGYHQARDLCGQDYKKLCGLDIAKLTPETQYGEAWAECAFNNWGKFSEGCKQVLRSVPLIGEMESELDRMVEHQAKQIKKKVKVRGTGQTVMSEFIEGDIVWYKAGTAKKKVLEQYDFCPKVDPKRKLKRQIRSDIGHCEYEVQADWRERVIKELRDNGLMEKIDHHGVIQSLLREEDSRINTIMEKYDHFCPEGFEADVENYVGNKIIKVNCAIKTRFFYCKHEYVEANQGIFGCVRLASCEETSDKYESIGDEFECGICYAGGCIDHERSAERSQMYPLCKVNYKNPGKTECEPYRISKSYYENGNVHYEARYKVNYLMEQIKYDEKGEMSRVKKIDHSSRWDSKEFDGKGRLRKETYNGTDHKFYDEQGNIIDIEQLKVKHAPDPVTGEDGLFRFKLDQAGRPLKQYTYKTVLLVKEWVRDGQGNVIKVIEYDEQGNVIKEVPGKQ